MQVLTSVNSLYVCGSGRHVHAYIRTGIAVHIAYNMCRSCWEVGVDTACTKKKHAFHKQMRNAFYSCLYGRQYADPSGRAVSRVGLRPFPCWDFGFESCRETYMFVCCECCVLSGRGLCIGLITRPEESYRVFCV